MDQPRPKRLPRELIQMLNSIDPKDIERKRKEQEEIKKKSDAFWDKQNGKPWM